VVNRSLTVTSSATLTLESGVIVKFSQLAYLTVGSSGTHDVQGEGTSSSTKVYFTSYKDDNIGGDTNGDGASSGAAGDPRADTRPIQWWIEQQMPAV
jgi:hypothetical protein